MTESVTDSTRRRRWVWAVAGLLLLGLSFPPAAYLFARNQGNRELATIRSQLDATDPNWRMPDLIAARNARLAQLPVNSADTVTAAVKLQPEAWDQPLIDDPWPGDSPLNRLPTAEKDGRVRAVHVATGPTRRFALALRDQPDGGSVITIPDYGVYAVNINLTPMQERRSVASILSLAVAIAALDNDPATAVDATRAGLNVARSVGDEPLLISQLVRMACTSIAVRSAERALGLCEPADELVPLQAAFHREAAEPFMRAGLMGELASVDQVMTNMRNGTIGAIPGTPTGVALSPFWAHDHATAIRLIKAFADDATRPPHARSASAAAEQALLAEPRYMVPMSQLLAQSASKVLEADARIQAQLLTAAVGLACERHRKVAGRWPASLDELPKEVLAAVPADPFDGRPLRFKRTPDGVVIYSIGLNKVDDGGEPGSGTGGDIVFRLFDPDKRRLPALPPAPDPAP